MNEIANRFLLICDKFMPKMHLRNACGPFTKKKKEYKTIKEQDIQYIFIKIN